MKPKFKYTMMRLVNDSRIHLVAVNRKSGRLADTIVSVDWKPGMYMQQTYHWLELANQAPTDDEAAVCAYAAGNALKLA